ncbi:Pkinase-domain-containing protein [Aulographum hederae CBS 113979]|uniref:non-specific serine/threonine protein kinase n=1 Tax=Aulographum hederae CBS 113979 TaxID=1176131 RepID=A0A6G1HEN6_9PEZI|nr:Pkinase-domain-containing protein [Aulographum hederae CBS 113979]
MDHHTQPARPPSRRKPLTDASSRANQSTPPTPSHQKSYERVQHQDHAPSSSPPNLPHNESFMAKGNGTLAVKHEVGSSENRRVVELAGDYEPESKRNSQVSQASTNASGTNKRRKTHIGPWNLGRTIGKGGCSRVRLVRHEVTRQKGAAKIISKALAEKARALSLANLVKSAEEDPSFANGKVMPFGLEREIVIMKLLNHPNIVQLYDVWENRNELYLIMEYVEGGELFEYIEQQRGLDEREVVYLFRQLIAALIYCHRLHIHHRDLKPENILLDRETFEIKLVDFGMAALQPEGKYLSTPCGSPHYAAPELLSYRPYDGGKADVWSCGVILFVMLTGSPPFNFPTDARGDMPEDKKLRGLFKAIQRVDYTLPQELSREAKHLLTKIFVADPSNRITTEEIWKHPFLHKYDKEFGFLGENATLEHWIGPRPTIENWFPLRLQDIDREILRNMRTLWHSEKEDTIIEKLLNSAPTQEKYFYSALVKHRDEHLENYVGTPGGVTYSASDYQHLKPESQQGNTPPAGYERSTSQFSILNNEHLHSMHSFQNQIPPSERSYDPFRASREPMPHLKQNYMNVTVHRGRSKGGSLKPAPSVGSRQRESLRVEALKKGTRRHSGLSARTASHASLRGSSRQRSQQFRGSTSKMSVASSGWTSSPPTIASMRPSSMHKRGVSFSHLRKSSTATALTSRANSVHHQTPVVRGRAQKESSANTLPIPSSPPEKPVNMTRSRKENLSVPATAQHHKLKSPSKRIREDIRKISTELEKACEDAFNRSSLSSSIRTTATDRRNPYLDTPPSSVNTPPNTGDKPVRVDTVTRNRPLPPLPQLPSQKETPKSYTARELAEMRNRIAVRHADADDENKKYLEEVLRHLEGILPGSDPENRSASAPQPQSPDDFGYLPGIPEESRSAEPEERETHAERERRWMRSVTAPTGQHQQRDRDQRDRKPTTDHNNNTIRLVDPSSPCPPIAPLNIRKASGASTTTAEAAAASINRPLTPHGHYGKVLADRYKRRTNQSLVDMSLNSNDAPEDMATVDNQSTGKDETVTKRTHWWNRRRSPRTPEVNDDQTADANKTALENAPTKRSARPANDIDPADEYPKRDFPEPAKWNRHMHLDDRLERNKPIEQRKREENLRRQVKVNELSLVDSEFPFRSEQAGNPVVEAMRKKAKDSIKNAAKEQNRAGGFLSMFRKKNTDSGNGNGTSPFSLTGETSPSSPSPNPFRPHSSYNKSPEDYDFTTYTDKSRPFNLADESSSSLANGYEIRQNDISTRTTPSDDRSWFARFFKIKPATRAFCVSERRGRARADLVHLLRDWRPHGIKDVVFDREANTIHARVHKRNAIGIDPVSFIIELFVILEDGHRTNVCIARFTQLKGSKSSFNRAFETVEDVFRSKNLLVVGERRKAMLEVLGY